MVIKMSNEQKREYRFLTTLAAMFVTFSIISVAVGYKLVAIGPYFLLSGAAFILPFRYLLGDIIAEVYGYKIAVCQIYNLVLACIVFSVAVTLIIKLPSPANWPHQSAFQYVLGGSLKIIAAALLGMFIGVYVNIFLLAKMKVALGVKSFLIRAFLASAAGELIQYIIALSIIYYSQLPFSKLLTLIISDYGFQAILIFLLTPFANVLMLIFKRIEKTDTQFVFDPFSSQNRDGESR